jgi:hypothetical protein
LICAQTYHEKFENSLLIRRVGRAFDINVPCVQIVVDELGHETFGRLLRQLCGEKVGAFEKKKKKKKKKDISFTYFSMRFEAIVQKP